MSQASLRLERLARTLRPVLVALLIVALVFVVLLGTQIQTALTELEEQPADNLHWNLTQLEVDLVRFGEELRIVSLDPKEPIRELRKRFDLFYSRAQNAIGGQGFTSPGLEDVASKMGALLSSYLARETPNIDVSDEELRRNLPQMISSAEKLRDELRQTSISMIERLAKLNDIRRATFGDLVHQMALALAASVGTLTVLLLLVIWLNGQATREARYTARISARLSATVNTSLDAIIVADSESRIIQYNPSAESIFGFKQEDVIGHDLGQLIVPLRMREAHAQGMERFLKDGSFKLVNSGRFETAALDASGREFPVELAISDAQGEDGTIFIAFIRDISARRAAQAQLMAARDEALAAERAKTNFLAVMSHEMRTPLNGVAASLEIVAGKATDPTQARFIALAQDSAAQLLRLANDVLDISRVESGGLSLDEEDFDLGLHLSGLVEAIRPLCEDKGISVDLALLSPLPPLHGDRFRIGQIVQNFLSNALKFVEEGGITVEAEVADSQGELRTIEVRVIDTGPGIAESDQERIFEEFVMLDPSFGRPGGGAGLGLAISRRLATAIGGEIGVEGEPGEGSCFWLRVTLPLAQSATVPAATPAATEAIPAQDVLVVEDNATNRAVLEEMLLHLGQRVTMANDGQSGADAARARRFDLILMDISMPVMDGLTATGLIRAKGASKASRIVAVTAHSMPADRDRFRAAGMDEVLEKPISLSRLSAILAHQVTAAPPQGDAVLDPVRLGDLRQALGAEGVARIVARFREDGESLKARLMEAVASQAPQEVTRALCHEAAGLAAVVGAQRLRGHFAKAELLCHDGHLAEARTLLADATESLWREALDAVSRQV